MMSADLPATAPDLQALVRTGGVSFLVALFLTAWARRAALRFGMLDLPNARSSHGQPTPRAGGLAILVATLAGLAIAGFGTIEGPAHGAFVLGLAGIAGIGLWDDRRGLSPFTRLWFQAALAAAFVVFSGGLDHLPLPEPLDLPLGWIGVPLAVVWIVAVINFYNFLDGIDGLAGLQAVVTGAGLALLGFDPLASLAGIALAAASLGFLVHNWSPARIFLGDAGSGLLGFAFAAMPLLAPPESRASTVLFAATSLWFFLADAVWTLARRVARGDRWYEAHREHLYQRLVTSGWGHAPVAAALGAASAVVTAVALAGPRDRAAIALLLAVLLFGVEVGLVAMRTRLRPAQTGPRA